MGKFYSGYRKQKVSQLESLGNINTSVKTEDTGASREAADLQKAISGLVGIGQKAVIQDAKEDNAADLEEQKKLRDRGVADAKIKTYNAASQVQQRFNSKYTMEEQRAMTQSKRDSAMKEATNQYLDDIKANSFDRDEVTSKTPSILRGINKGVDKHIEDTDMQSLTMTAKNGVNSATVDVDLKKIDEMIDLKSSTLGKEKATAAVNEGLMLRAYESKEVFDKLKDMERFNSTPEGAKAIRTISKYHDSQQAKYDRENAAKAKPYFDSLGNSSTNMTVSEIKEEVSKIKKLTGVSKVDAEKMEAQVMKAQDNRLKASSFMSNISQGKQSASTLNPESQLVVLENIMGGTKFSSINAKTWGGNMPLQSSIATSMLSYNTVPKEVKTLLNSQPNAGDIDAWENNLAGFKSLSKLAPKDIGRLYNADTIAELTIYNNMRDDKSVQQKDSKGNYTIDPKLLSERVNAYRQANTKDVNGNSVMAMFRTDLMAGGEDSAYAKLGKEALDVSWTTDKNEAAEVMQRTMASTYYSLRSADRMLSHKDATKQAAELTKANFNEIEFENGKEATMPKEWGSDVAEKLLMYKKGTPSASEYYMVPASNYQITGNSNIMLGGRVVETVSLEDFNNTINGVLEQEKITASELGTIEAERRDKSFKSSFFYKELNSKRNVAY